MISAFGFRFTSQDSEITFILNSGKDYLGYPLKPEISKINARSIDVVKLSKKGAVGQGILIGAISGLVVGGLIDLIYYSTWKNQEPGKASNFGDGLVKEVKRRPGYFAIQASLIGIACIGTGIGVGAAVGSVKITIPVNGSQEQFNRNKLLLKKYSVSQ